MEKMFLRSLHGESATCFLIFVRGQRISTS
jgi:hypothetical protein